MVPLIACHVFFVTPRVAGHVGLPHRVVACCVVASGVEMSLSFVAFELSVSAVGIAYVALIAAMNALQIHCPPVQAWPSPIHGHGAPDSFYSQILKMNYYAFGLPVQGLVYFCCL